MDRRSAFYLLIPCAIAQLSALELGLGSILAAVAGLAIIGETPRSDYSL